MQGQHELADLAPRDVVARAIIARMRETGTDHVYLDCRHLGADFLEQRFPSIVQRCRELGFDPATELLPVAPAQHYASGGVRTDLHGRSLARGPLRLRRDLVHGCARGQPPRLQLPARGSRLRAADR